MYTKKQKMRNTVRLYAAAKDNKRAMLRAEDRLSRTMGCGRTWAYCTGYDYLAGRSAFYDRIKHYTVCRSVALNVSSTDCDMYHTEHSRMYSTAMPFKIQRAYDSAYVDCEGPTSAWLSYPSEAIQSQHRDYAAESMNY